jgi:hypothetical protein
MFETFIKIKYKRVSVKSGLLAIFFHLFYRQCNEIARVVVDDAASNIKLLGFVKPIKSARRSLKAQMSDA